MSQNGIDYYEQLDRANRQRLLVRHQNAIIQAYDKAFRDAFDELKNYDNTTAVGKAKVIYTQQLYDELRRLNEEYPNKVSESVLGMQRDLIKEKMRITKGIKIDQRKFMNEIDKNVKVTNRKVIDMMVKGGIYKDGKGLDDRLWNSVSNSGTKIEVAIQSCMARGLGSAESSKIIKEFGSGGHRTWDRNKINEKLGSGYARRFSGGLDYEALRLMRTTHTHASQLAVKESANVNPYVGKVRWHSVHANGRTCSLCKSRDGRLFKLDKMPFDHPNGLCWMESVFTDKRGVIMTPDKMVHDLRNWIKGEPNSGTMDTLYGDIPLAKPRLRDTPMYKALTSRLRDEFSGHNIDDVEGKIDSIIKDLDKLPENVRSIYLKHGVNTFSYGGTPKGGGAYYRPKDGKVYLEIGYRSVGRPGDNDVLFHEWGHLIDGTIKGDAERVFKNVRLRDTLTGDGSLNNSLRQDMATYIRKQRRNGLTVEQAEKQLSKVLKEADTTAIAISDACKGSTNGRVQGNWGHDLDYYKTFSKYGNITESDSADIKCSSELWAETLSMTQYPEKIKWMEDNFPSYMGTFWELVEKVNKMNPIL